MATNQHIVKPSDGNQGVRFQDSTAKVAGILNNGVRSQVSGKKSGGCSGCNK